MNILLYMGSPRKNGSTAEMCKAFIEGAESAGHTVHCENVGSMKIGGCMACEYCHGKGQGECIQKDDMQTIYPLLKEADMLVLASPIYYFTMSAQIEAAIQRMYLMNKPPKAKKAALLLSSYSPGVYTGSIAQYKDMLNFCGMKDMGIITSDNSQNKTPAKYKEVRDFAASL